jgi:hypothetical protein
VGRGCEVGWGESVKYCKHMAWRGLSNYVSEH